MSPAVHLLYLLQRAKLGVVAQIVAGALGEGDLELRGGDADQPIEVEGHPGRILVGVGCLALDSAGRVVGEFARIAELKIDAPIAQAGSRAAPIAQQPRNRLGAGTHRVRALNQVSI